MELQMNTEKKHRQERNFLFCYTAIFILTAVLVFHWFPDRGRRMVWQGDGLSQHYVALCYYARWGRAVLRSILSGHPSFPTLNLHMGFGADLFTTLQYYVIGDPFSLPAVLVPQRYMLTFHDAMILLRMYLAGLCFDGYCRTMGHRDPAGNLCGALIYVFGSFTLFGMRHPYFINAMIWFPLLLIGAEHIFRGRKGRLFTLAVFLSCISNFYFFYMLVALTVVYAVWRAVRLRVFPAVRGGSPLAEAWKEVFLLAGRFLWRAGLGTALGACFLLPILLRFAQDPRASEGVAYNALYPAAYYRGMIESFIGFGTRSCLENWTCMGFGGIGLLGVLLLFFGGGSRDAETETCPEEPGRDGTSGRQGPVTGHISHPDLKIAFAAMLLMVLVPAAGAALNGFTYPANRWIWAFSLLTAYIAAVMLPSLRDLSAKRLALILLLVAAFAGACAALGGRQSTTAELLLAAAAAAAVWGMGTLEKAGFFIGPGDAGKAETEHIEPGPAGSGTGRTGGHGLPRRARMLPAQMLAGLVLTGAAVLTAALHGYVCFQRDIRSSGVKKYHTDAYIAAMMASDAAGMRTLLGNEDFYRYSGRYISNNFNLLNDVSDTQYYWSLSDGRVEQFFTETGQYNGMVHLYDNLDNRTMLDEIAGVRYYKRGDGSLLPFGYEKLEGLRYDNRELFTEEDGKEEDLPVFSFSVYENTYALPLGFTCGQYMTRQTFDGLTIPQRQEALMQGVLLEDEGLALLQARDAALPGAEENGNRAKIREADPVFTAREVPFTMYTEADRAETGSDAETSESPDAPDAGASGSAAAAGVEVLGRDETGVRLLVREADAVLRLKADLAEDLADGEISLLLTGMEYAPLPEEEKDPGPDAGAGREPKEDPAEDGAYSNTDPVNVEVTALRNDHVVSDKEVAYTLPDNPWKTGRKDFLTCCGYTEEPLQEIRMTFERPGIYSFRELKLVCQPMDSYPSQAQSLREYGLEDLDLHELAGSGATDRITGTIEIPDRRILCIQIPCLEGLRARVDGEDVPLLQADTMFSAVLLEAGRHEIELSYRTPGLAAGAWISVLALLVLAAETGAAKLRSPAGFGGRKKLNR